MKPVNIFENLPGQVVGEVLEVLSQGKAFTLKRIVSVSHVAELDGDWYDQEDDEWCIILKGSAGLRFEDQEDIVVMKPGDYLYIPAHCRHQVAWTEKGEQTVWLALHYYK